MSSQGHERRSQCTTLNATQEATKLHHPFFHISGAARQSFQPLTKKAGGSRGHLPHTLYHTKTEWGQNLIIILLSCNKIPHSCSTAIT